MLFKMTQRQVLIILSVAEMLALTLWFCTNAVLPQIEIEWSLAKQIVHF